VKLSRIVAGVDFCGPSVEAARWAALHFAPEAEVVVVHAIDVPTPPSVIRGRFPPKGRVVETARRGAERSFAELGAWAAGPRVTLEVREGRAADVLLEVADLRGADVVVVGPHGCRPGVWEILGTTAERVICEAAAPVLVARGLPPGAPRRILAAVDAGERTGSMLAWARFLGALHDARVIVLHAIAPVWTAWTDPAGAVIPLDVGEIRAEMSAWLEERTERAGFESEDVDLDVVVGDPAHEILSAAARHGADLVVMGTSGPGPLAHAGAGSVARAVLRTGSSAVFVVGPMGS